MAEPVQSKKLDQADILSLIRVSKAAYVMNTCKNCTKNYAFSGALTIPMSLLKQESCSAETFTIP